VDDHVIPQGDDHVIPQVWSVFCFYSRVWVVVESAW